MTRLDPAAWADDVRACTALLASLASIGPARLRLILAAHDAPDALQRLRRGRQLDAGVERFGGAATMGLLRAEAASLDPPGLINRWVAQGVRVAVPDDPDFPEPLAHDPAAPSVLFVRGDLAAIDRRRVAIVGTRNATTAGRATAAELGAELARAGVAVVSGLARGIDAAAHLGTRQHAGIPIAVVANGPGRAYPRQNAALWEWVADAGLLASEWPPDTAPHAWRFPLRNRILAGLCEVLVVVESRSTGGSLITADEAIRRGRTVLVVPGSPRAPASVGANRLLADGAAPVLTPDDVLVALGLAHHAGWYPHRGPELAWLEHELLQLCLDRPVTIDRAASALGVDVAEVALGLLRLERSGLVIETQGWFELARSRLGPHATTPEVALAGVAADAPTSVPRRGRSGQGSKRAAP